MIYAIHDSTTGDVVRYQTCPEDELQFNLREGEDAIAVDSVPTAGRHGVVGGRLVQLPDQPDQRPYTARRADGYPSIGDQLDALWHAMDTGLMPKVPAFYDPIKAVKDDYPKPPAG